MKIGKSIRTKTLYVVMAIVLMAGLVPLSAIPAAADSRATAHLHMYLVNPDGTRGDEDSGYNAAGSIVEVEAEDADGNVIAGTAISGWTLLPVAGTLAPTFVPGGPKAGVNPVQVQGDFAEAIIQATLVAGGPALQIDKKWGKISNTVIDGAQSIPVVWNESAKAWSATASVTDLVNGNFISEGGPQTHVVQGTILNWYLLRSPFSIDMTPAETPVVQARIKSWMDSTFVDFVDGDINLGTRIQTVTDASGESTVDMVAIGEESVTVVVIPQYPAPIQYNVVPEVTTINFWTREMEVVPQVRWAGEKIVLEKNFGTTFHPRSVNDYPLFLVKFSLENQSGGSLEGIGNTFMPIGGLNLVNTTQTVWTTVDAAGLASVVLWNQDQGAVNVDVTLYAYYAGNDGLMMIENQHAFTVYYLKLESVELGNVVGKRDGHDTGDFVPENPWDSSTDTVADTLNVSQDTLLRATVKGWFTNANMSIRPELEVDIDGDQTTDLTLPKGRWILPDDWAKLAGPNWTSNRIHWDIMNAPNDDTVFGDYPLGDYELEDETLVAEADVIGPFAPGQEIMTPTGWEENVVGSRDIKTVVPNGMLDWWDAPMPPAKVMFEILDVKVTGALGYDIGNSGFFKTADKDDIYYVTMNAGKNNEYKLWTNPFYEQLIPAHPAIPAFINNGGYDWDSAQDNYGPYEFWTIINRPDMNAQVGSDDPAGHPTKVEVYSDNHGEAMVYLNGDWNLNLRAWDVNGAADVSPGATVGSTTVQAMADYPYTRVHQAFLSNTVTKTWTWGGLVLGTDANTFQDGVIQGSSKVINSTGSPRVITGGTFPDEVGTSPKKMVWVFLTDRDGMIDGVDGATISWSVGGGAGFVSISPTSGDLSEYNHTMQNIFTTNGFLAGTNGVATSATTGTSVARALLPHEEELFAKFYPNEDPENFAVAGLELWDTTNLQHVTVALAISAPDFMLSGNTILRTVNVNWATSYPFDDQILLGDATADGNVNMGDVVAVVKQILGLAAINANADANGDGKVNMGDVVRIERMILGLP